jgi:hypothetical protein
MLDVGCCQELEFAAYWTPEDMVGGIFHKHSGAFPNDQIHYLGYKEFVIVPQ